MTDLQLAVKALDGHSVCLCREGRVILFDGRGISPLIDILQSGADYSGYSAADIIVGKAAAVLFLKMGITSVYGRVMSESAKNYLQQHSIEYSYDTLTEKIINRSKTDICPMEKTVADIDDCDTAYTALRKKLAELKSQA